MLFKRLGAIFFAIAFFMAIGSFTSYFIDFLPREIARIGMLFSGAVAMLFNVLDYRTNKDKESTNLFFWLSSFILFIGLFFKIMHWPGSSIIILIGLTCTGISFFYNPFSTSNRTSDDDLLDQ